MCLSREDVCGSPDGVSILGFKADRNRGCTEVGRHPAEGGQAGVPHDVGAEAGWALQSMGTLVALK